MESTSNSKCLICNSPVHGIHFGVQSCRACAAFYRRTIVHLKKYKCRSQARNCKTKMCRYCRFQKCVEVGMTSENVMYNYDCKIGNEKNKDGLKNELENDLRFEVAKDKNGEIKIKLDVSGLLNNIKRLLTDPFPVADSINSNISDLAKMEIGLLEYQEINQSKVIEYVQEVSMKSVILTSNKQIKSISKFFMHSKEFRELGIHDKIQMIKTVWVQWKRLERYVATAKIFGKRMYEEQIMMLLPGTAGHINKIKLDSGDFIYRQEDGLKFYMETFNCRMMEHVGKPLVDLDLSTTEVAFMLSQLSWQVAGKELQGEVLKASEIAQEKIADDLHLYYSQYRKVQNYATRMMKIANIINSTQKMHYERQNLTDLIRIFDFCRVEVSDPEMYKSYF